MISIIIPAFNEEKYLPKLLESIKRQDYKDYEVIVADANSTDKTRQIAKKFGCRIVKGGMPAAGRNNGAKAAKGDILLFLDADVLLDDDFLQNSIEEFKKRKIDCASVKIVPQSSKVIDKIFLGAFNSWVIATQGFYPHAIGACIFCRKLLHNKIRGFDEKIAIAEDMDYVRRAGKHGKFRILKKARILFSMRRYEKHGYLNVASKIILGEIRRIFAGELKKDVFNYQLRYRK